VTNLFQPVLTARFPTEKGAAQTLTSHSFLGAKLFFVFFFSESAQPTKSDDFNFAKVFDESQQGMRPVMEDISQEAIEELVRKSIFFFFFFF